MLAIAAADHEHASATLARLLVRVADEDCAALGTLHAAMI
jgi:hypothetical protein